MNKFILSVMCLMLPWCAWSQVSPFDNEKVEVLDNAIYRFNYHLKFVPDTKKRNTVQESDHILLIGNKYSKFFNALYEVKQDHTKDYAENIDSEGIGDIEVIKNLQTNKMTVIEMHIAVGNWEYQESIPNIKWKITNEKKEIQGYKCQKAICNYLGRTYEAWFSSEIPIKNGPWKFGNLPGLILAVSDTKGDYSFMCVGIKKVTHPDPIVKYSVKTKKTNRKTLNKMMKRFHENPVAILKALSGEEVPVRVKSKGRLSDAEALQLTIPYNPIELE